MGQNNKLILSLLTALVIVVAVLSSFGMNLFGSGTPQIQLPTLSELEPSGGTGETVESGDVVQVAVTPKTVQSVIAGLNRWVSYDRTVTVEMYYENQRNGTFTAQVWEDQGWTRIAMDGPRSIGGTQYTILGEETLYRWYSTDQRVVSWPSEGNDPDLAQHIPTYQDVLALDADQIVSADYVAWEGVPCIYVETLVPDLDYVERFWVSVDNGLLMASETWKEETLILQMYSSPVNALALDEMVFALPDGTVLHDPNVL